MKKKLMLFIILVFLIPLTYGCGQDNLGDDYIEGSDYQYMLDNQLNSGCTKARGENGYFFLQGHYIYYLDDNTHSLVALCNKADCLHNGETDSDRYSDCNAYLEVGADTIAYCNGYLYVLDSADSNPVLYRIKEDGSKREVVKKWEEENVCIDLWSIHRDVFYCVERTYAVEDGEVVQHYAVMKMTIGKGSSSSPVCIYEQPDGVYLSSIGTIRAYGNYFWTYSTETDESGSDEITTKTLQWFDKSTLGTYHGEEFVFSSAAVWDAAPADGT